VESSYSSSESVASVVTHIRPELRPYNADIIGDKGCALRVGIKTKQACGKRIGSIARKIFEKCGRSCDASRIKSLTTEISQEFSCFGCNRIDWKGDYLKYAGL